MQKYKVFINDHLIIFGGPKDFNKEKNILSKAAPIKENELDFLIEKIKSQEFHQSYYLICEDAQKVFLQFTQSFKVLKAAGGLVLNDKDQILMIHRFEHWDFPKGKIEENESQEQAALREVMEETGVEELTITRSLPNVYHIYIYKTSWILKDTYWFLMQSDFSGVLKPQLEEDILAAIWVPLNYMQEYMGQSYLALRDLVDQCKLFR